MAKGKTVVRYRKPAPARRGRIRKPRDSKPIVMGSLGAMGTAVLQGQVHRRCQASGYKQAPRIIGVVSGLASVALAMTGHETAAIIALGSATGQAAIESSLVDLMPATVAAKK